MSTTITTDEQRAEIIRAEVYRYLNVQPDQPGRRREIVEARQFSMYYIKRYTKLSLVRIGRMFGKDHATVLHACRTIQNLIDVNGYGKHDGRMRFAIERELPSIDNAWMERVAQL